jgi:uncharacterized protein (TIGR00369 family)
LTSEVARPSAVDRPDRSARPDRPAIETSTGRFEFEPHNCFACGSLNVNGLQLDLHVKPGRCWTEFTLDKRFEGWEGIAHGGILCTILDEVMAWALVGEDNWGVTARMNVAFRRPVEVGRTVRAEGWITEARRRVVDTAARIVDAGTDDLLATATGAYVAASAERKRYLRERYAFRPVEAVAATPDEVAGR